ncbi:MAG: glycoside hydrolase family 10 protein [Brevinema sp.]
MIRLFLCCFMIIPTITNSLSPKRELRAAWIATVFNIDWPSANNLSKEQQKKELSAMLDTLEVLKFNAVILQVKPTSDAFYKSKLSPWSQFLTGKQGKNPGYDPLEYFIQEAQKRNLETHVWINPFRILNGNSDLTDLSPNHIALKNPSWVIEHDGRYYFDPGNPKVQDYVIKEVLEIVNNYDIDVLHMDDYFYPYTVYRNGKYIHFNDNASWKKFGMKHFDNRGDWRRDNVNRFVKNISEKIKKSKPYVKFGISPFGVWRNKSSDPKGSDTKAGQQNYDDLYADVLKWVDHKWVDYIMPQIYWHFDTKAAPYDVLVQWWQDAIKDRINLYVGLGVYKLRDQKWPASYITDQVNFARKQSLKGMSHYNISTIHQNINNISNEIAQQIYKNYSLVPINNNLMPIVPLSPDKFTAETNNNTLILRWENHDSESTRYFLLYRFDKNQTNKDSSIPENIIAKISVLEKPEYKIKNFDSNYTYGISAVSRLHYESGLTCLEKTERSDAFERIDDILRQEF